jgi:DUF2946 family protein
MDEIVALAMQKWPNVPDVYGWLGLDRRGNWLLKGERIGNPALNAFISRNYARGERGRWYFQNGPQRVFVSLQATPYVFSLEHRNGGIAAIAHTGVVTQQVEAALIDAAGALILLTELGPGIVHDRDLGIALEAARYSGGAPVTEEAIAALQRGEAGKIAIGFGRAQIPLQALGPAALAARFGFDPDPKPPA